MGQSRLTCELVSVIEFGILVGFPFPTWCLCFFVTACDKVSL